MMKIETDSEEERAGLIRQGQSPSMQKYRVRPWK